MTRVQGVRRTGSAALDLVYVGRGTHRRIFGIRTQAWDIAAGALIVNEARGRVTNIDGSDLDLSAANIVASNSRIHDELIDALASARPEADRRHAEMMPSKGQPPAPSQDPEPSTVCRRRKSTDEVVWR